MDVPSEDRTAEFYEYAVDENLQSHGISRYEISNFAAPGAESVHNLKYWWCYIGFAYRNRPIRSTALSAGQNVETAADYIARSERGEGRAPKS